MTWMFFLIGDLHALDDQDVHVAGAGAQLHQRLI
jgi:hypothetical protein